MDKAQLGERLIHLQTELNWLKVQRKGVKQEIKHTMRLIKELESDETLS